MSLKMGKWLLPLLALGSVLFLSGCGNFFTANNSSGGSSGGGSNSGSSTSSVVYVGNSSSATVAGFGVSTTGAFSAVTNSPYSTNVYINSMAMSPTNSYLYVGSDGYIYGFSVSTTGALTVLNSGNPLASLVYATSMKVDSTGKWLIVADSLNYQLSSYAINTSTGLLSSGKAISFLGSTKITGSNPAPISVAMTPNNLYAYVSMGVGGVDIFGFDSSTGAFTLNGNLSLGATNTTQRYQGMAVDSTNSFFFVTETNAEGLRVFSIRASDGALSEVSGSPYTTGTGPYSVVVDPSNAYVYVANRSDGNISAFSFVPTTGKLTAISGSPFTTGGTPVDMSFDKTKTYLVVAATGGNPDLQSFKIDTSTPGKLVSVGTTSTGSSNATGSPISFAVTRY